MSLGMAFGKTWEKHRATDRFAPWISFLQFFCFHDDLISFSFAGTQLPVSGVSGDNMEHNTKHRLSRKPTATGTGGCSLTRLTTGRKLRTVTTWKVPALSNCDHSWDITARAWLGARSGSGNHIPPAGLSPGRLSGHSHHHRGTGVNSLGSPAWTRSPGTEN